MPLPIRKIKASSSSSMVVVPMELMNELRWLPGDYVQFEVIGEEPKVKKI
jgi:hypothetical protein